MNSKCKRVGCDNDTIPLLTKQENGYCGDCSLMINPIYARLVEKFKRSKRYKTAITIRYNDVEYMRKHVLATTFIENSLSRLGKVTSKKKE